MCTDQLPQGTYIVDVAYHGEGRYIATVLTGPLMGKTISFTLPLPSVFPTGPAKITVEEDDV